MTFFFLLCLVLVLGTCSVVGVGLSLSGLILKIGVRPKSIRVCPEMLFPPPVSSCLGCARMSSGVGVEGAAVGVVEAPVDVVEKFAAGDGAEGDAEVEVEEEGVEVEVLSRSADVDEELASLQSLLGQGVIPV